MQVGLSHTRNRFQTPADRLQASGGRGDLTSSDPHATAVRDALLTPYVDTLIRIKAMRLVRHPLFRRSELSDVEQELRACILKAAHYYDPQRGAVSTFIDRVVKSSSGMLIRSRSSLKRAAGERVTSLNASRLFGEDGSRYEVGNSLDANAIYRRLGIDGSTDQENAEQAIDVASVLATLPPHLKSVAAGLTASDARSVARALAISRGRIYRLREKIGMAFVQAGLGNTEPVLGHPPGAILVHTRKGLLRVGGCGDASPRPKACGSKWIRQTWRRSMLGPWLRAATHQLATTGSYPTRSGVSPLVAQPQGFAVMTAMASLSGP